jgi:hypothetical protein
VRFSRPKSQPGAILDWGRPAHIAQQYNLYLVLRKNLTFHLNILSLFRRFALAEQWKGINRKQSTRWQHLSRLKASEFFSLQKNFSCYETQQLILGTGTAIWWVTEPHCQRRHNTQHNDIQHNDTQQNNT